MAISKAIAGYRVLMILSVIDGKYSRSEGKVIVDYLRSVYDEPIDVEGENAFLQKMGKMEVMTCFHEAASFFYGQSEEDERKAMLDYAHQLVLADKVLTEEENKLLKELYRYWLG